MDELQRRIKEMLSRCRQLVAIEGTRIKWVITCLSTSDVYVGRFGGQEKPSMIWTCISAMHASRRG